MLILALIQFCLTYQEGLHIYRPKSIFYLHIWCIVQRISIYRPIWMSILSGSGGQLQCFNISIGNWMEDLHGGNLLKHQTTLHSNLELTCHTPQKWPCLHWVLTSLSFVNFYSQIVVLVHVVSSHFQMKLHEKSLL